MTEDLLEQTVRRVPEWTQGTHDASRIFYSKNNMLCVVVKPFICQYGNRQLLEMSEEAYVPDATFIFFDTDPYKLAQKVRRHVIFSMTKPEYHAQD